ncbi:MAG TPA: sulfatase, partial [Polyangiaceae bacterium]|nr:sulfatase [Polyangiaceae bacterium]
MAFRSVSLAALSVVAALLPLAGCSNDSNGLAASSAPPSPPSSAPPKSSAEAPASPTPTAPAAASAAAGSLEPMNVVLLVIDAMRDDMPWNGYGRDIAPNLTKYYQQSVRWERGYSISSFTARSVAGLLSGKYPSSLARNTTFFTTWKQKNDFMAESLQAQGVRTLGGHAHMYFKSAAGFHQGFDSWEIVPKIEWDYDRDPYITSPDHVKLVQSQLSKPENVSGKFFAYYHFMDPHHDYHSHEDGPDFGKKNRDRYDEEMYFTDRHLQKVFDFVETQPWGKRTAVIVTADHGEAFGEKGLLKHAYEVYEVLVRVPLFLHIPGVQPKTIPRWRSHVDLVPTIFDLLGVKKPEGLPGTSLMSEIVGEPQPQRPVICDLPADTLNVRRRALIDEQGMKLISFGRDVRYEL